MLLKADEVKTRGTASPSQESNQDLFVALGLGLVGGGTAWLWSRPDAFESVDVLFVDEAAQMSLANVLAVSQAAKTLVLIGDPQQLDQPMQGSHPEGPMFRRLTTFWAESGPSVGIRDCSWKRPGGSIQPSGESARPAPGLCGTPDRCTGPLTGDSTTGSNARRGSPL